MDAKSKISSKVFRKPKRVSITIPHATYLQLERRCYEEGRSLSGLSAYLLEWVLSHDSRSIARIDTPVPFSNRLQ
jgi:hypothetical protein